MTDSRRYTGTQRLQLAWTVVAVTGLVVTLGLTDDGTVRVLLVAGLSIGWLAGLVGLGFRERRRWNKLVERSSFSQRSGPRSTDIEKIIGGRSVTVTTNVPGILGQAHTTVQTPVEDVDAEFTVQIRYVGSRGTDEGLTTGNKSLDERFVFDGTKQNVAHVLSTDVQAALMDIETPATCTVTGKRVSYEVPFTQLSADELDTIAETVLTVARRVEAVASGDEE